MLRLSIFWYGVVSCVITAACLTLTLRARVAGFWGLATRSGSFRSFVALMVGNGGGMSSYRWRIREKSPRRERMLI